jgi:FtsX-like permease family
MASGATQTPIRAAGSAARVAWYRFRATFRRRLGGYLTLAVLIGLVGGVAMAAVTAARRTDSSYPDYLAATNPSDLIVQPQVNDYVPGFRTELAGLKHVRSAEMGDDFNAVTVTPAGKIGTVLITQVELLASPDGLFSRQDRVVITRGRAASPARPDEVVATTEAAAILGLHVGSHILVGLDTSTAHNLIPFHRKLDLTVVGIGELNFQVVRDNIDAGRTGFLIATPALAREYGPCCSSTSYDGLQLAGGSRYDPAVEQEYDHLLDTSPLTSSTGGQLVLYVTSEIEAEAQRAIRPEAIALGVFGIIAGLAALIIGMQSISRQLRALAPEAEVLRALGAGPATTVADGAGGLLGAVIVGALMAAAVAAGLSPLTLFGPVREAGPPGGLYLDWTVLGLGAACLVLLLGGAAAFSGYWQSPHRISARARSAARESAAVRAARGAGLPTPAVAGLRLAVEPGRGGTAVPVRSVIAGAVLAATVGVATLTFGASLATLISHPALYGWNFSYAIYAIDGYGPLPASWTSGPLHHDPLVAAASGVYFGTVQVDGQTVPAMATPVRAAVAPRPLSGSGLDGSGQIVLGPATLAQLRKRIGQAVRVSEGELIPPVTLRIAGTAALPTIGDTLGIHASMSTGAILPVQVIPTAVLHAYGPISGPNAIFVRLRPGVSQAAGLRSLEQLTRQINADGRSPEAVAVVGNIAHYGNWASLLPVQRPAEIVNYKSMGAMPAVLAGGLAAGAVGALGLALVASVRRRRRDFALLKTLGFTRGQLAGAVAWQSSAIAVLGLVIGVPLGIAAGRWLWLAFANQLSAVPDPVVPAASITLAAVAALILANLVAALPGRAAARTPAALLLRAE